VSAGRLVTWATDAAGTRDGTSGQTLGPASRHWACSDAAVRCWRHPPAGQPCLARLAHKRGQGNARTALAHAVARAVSDLLQRAAAFALDAWRNDGWRGAGEPAASRDASGLSLPPAPLGQGHGVLARSGAPRPFARLPLP
jgi:hypothetical protein